MGVLKRGICLIALLSSLSSMLACDQVGARVAADKGFHAYNEKNFEDAIQFYEDAYKRAPGNKTIKRNLAYAYLAKAHDTDLKEISEALSDKAIIILKDLLKQSPSDLEVASVLMDAWMQAGKLDDAAAYFKQRTLANPKDEEALRMLAVIEVQRGNYKDALDVYETRKKLKPDDVQIYVSIATLCWEWLHSGAPITQADAIQVATRGLDSALEANKRDPKHPTILVYAGLLLRERAKFQADPALAQKDIQQAQELLKKIQPPKAAAPTQPPPR